jgi:thrombospondin type 3 repeat protein
MSGKYLSRGLDGHKALRLRPGTRGAAILTLLLLVPTAAPTCLQDTEPNDSAATSNLIRFGEFGQGANNPSTDEDFWRAPGASVGDLVFAYVDTDDSTMSDNSFLQVLANDGTTLIKSDDDDGPGVSSAVAGAVVSQAGTVFYRIIELGLDAVITDYDLYQVVVDPTDISGETEGNGTSGTANTIRNTMTSGAVAGADEDYFKFRAGSGNSLTVIMDNDPGNTGSQLDSIVYILDTDGTTGLATGDNFPTVTDANAAGAIAAPADGIYYVFVQNGGLSAGTSYRFVLLVNGVPYSDGDGDLIADTNDNCPLISNAAQTDPDGDGVGSFCEFCDLEILKTTASDCGCDQPDIDHNGDGTTNCGLADPARALLSRVGLLLVADDNKNRVMAFDPEDGDLVDPDFIPTDAVNLPNPVASILGPNQNIVLVSDGIADVIQAYDFDGNYLGIFAPAGGVNLAIMDGPAGLAIRPNGNVVVCVRSGGNANAVAEFDAGGNHVGNFIAAGAGGLSGPLDLHFFPNGNVLVTDSTGKLRTYSAAGAFIGEFATMPGGGSPIQVTRASDSTVRTAVSLGERRGINLFRPNGTFVSQHAPAAVTNFIGLAELANGNWLVTGQLLANDSAPGGAVVLDSAGNVTRTVLRGSHQLNFVEHVIIDADGDGVGNDLDGCPSDPNKSAPGQCGCSTPDTDNDGDGTANCDDECPNDANKTTPGVCGCGAADSDANANGTPDCNDVPPPPPPGPQPTPGCCAPGVFPVAGLFLPACLFGWRWRRWYSRQSMSP